MEETVAAEVGQSFRRQETNHRRQVGRRAQRTRICIAWLPPIAGVQHVPTAHSEDYFAALRADLLRGSVSTRRHDQLGDLALAAGTDPIHGRRRVAQFAPQCNLTLGSRSHVRNHREKEKHMPKFLRWLFVLAPIAAQTVVMVQGVLNVSHATTAGDIAQWILAGGLSGVLHNLHFGGNAPDNSQPGGGP